MLRPLATGLLGVRKVPRSVAGKPWRWTCGVDVNTDLRCGAVRCAMVNGNQVKPRDYIRLKGRIWEVKSAVATRTGKGGAYAQLELRDVANGKKRNERVRAAESVETVESEGKRTFDYLYPNGDNMVLMETEPPTYEQVELPLTLLGDQAVFLKDGVKVSVETIDGEPMLVNLADFHVKLRVVETRGAQNHVKVDLKPAMLENGLQVRVPGFINVDDEIMVDVRDHSFQGRAD